MKALLLWTLAATLSSAVTSQNTDLQSCLTSATSLKMVTPSDGIYSNASQPFNLRLTPSPQYILYPSSSDQVSHIVTCASSASVNVSVRSGGHSYAAYGLSGNVVVDLSNFKNLSVDDSGVVVAQTGLLLGELAEGLWNQGQRALPHGTCPYVGTGGHALYGGFGYYSRVAGLLLDRIISADVVLANGTTVTASNISNPDLFWALRGAGASFGIVTSWKFDSLPAPQTTVYYQITFDSPLSADDVTKGFVNWQQFATGAPNELAMSAVLAPAGKRQMSLVFEGTYYGSSTQFNSIIQALLPQLPPSSKLKATPLGWLEGLVAVDGSLDTSNPGKPNTFYAKSLVTTQPFANDSVASWVHYLFGPGLSTNTTWFAEVNLYGGAIASVTADATAFAHRNAFLVYQFYANSPDELPPFPSDGIPLVDNMLSALTPEPTAAYPNYIDPTLTSDQWQSLYFADHIARLQQIKQEVDPTNLFNFQQAITPERRPTNTNGTSPSHTPSTASPSYSITQWFVTISPIIIFWLSAWI